MLSEIKKDADLRMQRHLDALHQELAKLRTGRAHPSLLDQVTVVYYGNPSPLSQVATISVADARTLLITPWEKSTVPSIEKGIIAAGLGLNPVTVGNVIRVPLPPLTEERRKDMIKVVKSAAEDARVSVRTARRDANTQLKELLKKKTITEDDERRAQDEIQKLTDKFIAEIDKILVTKEKELMEI